MFPKIQFKNTSPKLLGVSDFNACEKIFKDTAESLIGEQMMFAIIENIREFLIEKNDVFVEQKIKEDEERRLKEENKSTMYTTEKKIEFNRETFTKWLKDFGEERKKLKLEALKNRTKEEIERDERMTGKAYFQQKQHISGSGIVFDDDEIDKILEDDPSAAGTSQNSLARREFHGCLSLVCLGSQARAGCQSAGKLIPAVFKNLALNR